MIKPKTIGKDFISVWQEIVVKTCTVGKISNFLDIKKSFPYWYSNQGPLNYQSFGVFFLCSKWEVSSSNPVRGNFFFHVRKIAIFSTVRRFARFALKTTSPQKIHQNKSRENIVLFRDSFLILYDPKNWLFQKNFEIISSNFFRFVICKPFGFCILLDFPDFPSTQPQCIVLKFTKRLKNVKIQNNLNNPE